MEEVAAATDHRNNNKAGDNDEGQQDTVTSRTGGARRKAETPRQSAAPRRVPDTSSAAAFGAEPGPEVGLGLYADPDADCSHSHYCQGWSRGQNYTLSATKCTVSCLCPRLMSSHIYFNLETS